jgi:rubredoxin
MKINFACENCLQIFDVDMIAIEFDQYRDLLFNPLPECPNCGATKEIFLSNYGQEQIEDMMFQNNIKIVKANYSRGKK